MVKYDVLVCGVVTTDVIFSSIPKLPEPGEEIYCKDFNFTCGSVYNTAVALSRLGMKVAIVTPFGNDFLSQFANSQLEAEGVSTEFVKQLDYPLPILSVALNYGGDRSLVSYEEDFGDFDLQAYTNSIVEKVDAKVIHLNASLENKSTIELAKEKGLTISLDVGWNESLLKGSELKELIKMADIFTPNLKEALVITNKKSAEDALTHLHSLHPKGDIVIKLGEEGALLKQDTIIQIPADKREAIDTTGAGDVFSAGFLAGILKGFDLKEAVRLGNYCGGKSVEGLGGTEKSPYWSDVINEFLNPNEGVIHFR
jgi:sugar/nucleoside kinase (ribokinase family)